MEQNPSVLLKFNLRCTQTEFQDKVCLFGSSNELGKWGNGILLTTSKESFPHWESDFLVIELENKLEFKFCVIKDSGAHLWESFPNNRFLSLQNLSKGVKYETSEMFFNELENTKLKLECEQTLKEEDIPDFFLKIYQLPKFREYIKATDLAEARLQKIDNLYLSLLPLAKKFSISLPEISKFTDQKYSKIVKLLNNSFLQFLSDHIKPFFSISSIIFEKLGKNKLYEKLVSKLAIDLSNKAQYDFLVNSHIEKIQHFLKTSTNELFNLKDCEIKENEDRGANFGFIVKKSENEKYYIKTFTQPAKDSKIDCRELFLYKIFEYIKFGPKSEFLLEAFSSGPTMMSNSSNFNSGNYIITKDVCSITLDESLVKEKQFYFDDDPTILPIYLEAFDKKDFLIQFYSLMAAIKIFCAMDTFGENYGNYGLLKTKMKDDSINFAVKVIDHLPIGNNGELNFGFSPGRELNERVFGQRARGDYSSLKTILKERKEFSTKKLGITEEVKTYLNNLEMKKQLERAKEEIMRMVKDSSISMLFTQENIKIFEKNQWMILTAPELLDNFCKKVEKNIEVFEKSY